VILAIMLDGKEPTMSTGTSRIAPHHEASARAWGQGGRAYDDISFALSDALAHAAERLGARAGQEILDVATGTGWSARNAARRGARVTGVDIAPELLAAAAALSAHVEPPIAFEHGDAERLPFADRRFDGIVSTFGVIFAVGQAQAAAELARVCRPGGRLVITAWTPDGSVAEFLGIVARHAAAPPPPVSPLRWGDPTHAERLLGRDFDLVFEPGVNDAYHESEDEIWERYTRGFGPLRELHGRLDPAAREALRADMEAYHRHYRTPLGLHVRREYLLIRGVRR
jgi:SAM-dependent methyltransferase